jgi:GT2 family glycosyltransferase
MQYFGDTLADVAKLPECFEVDALPGDGVLVPTAVFKKIGLYNAEWCPQYHGDSEFSYRAKMQGVKVMVSTKAEIINNDFVSVPKFNKFDEMFSKKSWHYWRPVCFFYCKYAPISQKPYIVKQFSWLFKRS